MPGAKGAKLAARAIHGMPKKHYCPICMKDTTETTPEMEAKPIMMMPGRRMFYDCKNGHRHTRDQTILM